MEEKKTWLPLTLHRPAIEGEHGYWLPRGGGHYSTLPFTPTPQPDYPAFEFCEPFAHLTLQKLRAFCRLVGAAGARKTKEDCIQTIEGWQEALLLQLGFVSRQPSNLVDFYDWGKAIQRRTSYDWDRCQLIDATGFMEIRDVSKYLTAFVKSPDRGYVQVLTVDLQSRGWSGYSGKLITKEWAISQHSDANVLMEPPVHASRETYLAMIMNPDAFPKLFDEQQERSAAAYEIRKYQRVLSETLKTLGDSASLKPRWHIRFFEALPSYKIANECCHIIDLPDFADTQRVQLRFNHRGRGTWEHNDTLWVYDLPAAIAPLLLLAFFTYAKELLLSQAGDKFSGCLPEPNPGKYEPYEYDHFRMFCRWLKQLEGFAIRHQGLQESLEAQQSDELSAILIGQLKKL